MASRDDSARAGRYDDEVKVLTTQISFLEEEVAALRGRLADSPRQVRLLEAVVEQARNRDGQSRSGLVVEFASGARMEISNANQAALAAELLQALAKPC